VQILRYVRAFLIAGTLALAAETSSARAQYADGRTIDGIRCEAMEQTAMHIHQHVAIYDHGKPVTIPDDVGRPITAQCFYWLHTHTPDGIIHVEAPSLQSFTLGQFFDVWGEPLSRTNVAGAKPRRGEHIAVYVDGNPYAGDPRKIELTLHLDVAIRVGPPYGPPPPFTAWNGN
jgi:hypothetical protein